MKQYIKSPIFTPVIVLMMWSLLMNIIFIFYPETLRDVVKEGNFTEQLTYFCYLILFLSFVRFYKPFMNNKSSKTDFVIFIFFALCALLREMGIQHMLASKDTTAFKSRFFLNPNNPWHEKVIAGLILLIVLAAVIFMAVKYGKHLILSFFKLNPTTWSIATLCTMGVFGKFADRFPANYERYTGSDLAQALKDTLEIVEETSEMFLPVTATTILWQYWIIKKKA